MTESEKTVLITDHTWPSIQPEREILARAGLNVLEPETGEEAELVRLVSDVDAILTCFSNVSSNVIRAGRKLRIIGRYGIGVDNIDVTTATQLGILVANVPAYCLDEVAEHALALLLACARNILAYDASIRGDDWSLQAGRPLYRVRSRRLGIVGFGKIGRILAEKARGLGLEILAHDPILDDDAIRSAGARPAGLDELLCDSDFVSLHVPLTPMTRHLIDAGRLELMKRTAFLINTSRGGVVDLEALRAALIDGRLAGAALDVFEPERPAPGHPIWQAPNLILTPHVAFYSEESVIELEVKAAHNVAAIFNGQLPPSIINHEVLSLPQWRELSRSR